MSQIFYYLLLFSMSKHRTFDITHSPNLSLCPIKCLSSVRQMLGKIEVSACPIFYCFLLSTCPNMSLCPTKCLSGNYSLTCMILFVFMNVCTSRKKMITIQESTTKNTDYFSILCQFLTPK